MLGRILSFLFWLFVMAALFAAITGLCVGLTGQA